MIVYVCVGLLVITTFNTLPAESHPVIESSVTDGSEQSADAINVIAGDSTGEHGGLLNAIEDSVNKFYGGEINGKREKRSGIVRLFKKGLRAAKFLLKDTVVASHVKNNIRESQKQGTLKTAMKDFYSVNPIFVEKLKFPGGVTGRSGQIGDRTIILKNRGNDGRPTIEIMQTHKSDPLIDRITYTKNNPLANGQGYVNFDL